jgi:hypothetical protein
LLNEARPDPSLTGRALELLRRAIESGFPVAGIRDDADFQSIRSEPLFQKWTN